MGIEDGRETSMIPQGIWIEDTYENGINCDTYTLLDIVGSPIYMFHLPFFFMV